MLYNFIDDNHTVLKKDGALWLLVFYHNTTFGDYFHSLDEVYDSHTAQKFSILGIINEAFKIRNKYEFLLDVPGFKGFNRWRQKYHPNETTQYTNSTMNEYEPIKISWVKYFYGGLAVSNDAASFLDCSTDQGDWWYPIGAKRCYLKSNTIPIYMNNGNESPEIRLWVRVPSGIIPSHCKCNYRQHHINTMLVVTVFLTIK